MNLKNGDIIQLDEFESIKQRLLSDDDIADDTHYPDDIADDTQIFGFSKDFYKTWLENKKFSIERVFERGYFAVDIGFADPWAFTPHFVKHRKSILSLPENLFKL